MKNYLVFDLETQRGAQEVGGWGYIENMLYSVAVVWDSSKNDFFVYYEHQVAELIAHLTCGYKVIGFNHLHFDYKVISGYAAKLNQTNDSLLKSFFNLKNLDLLISIKNIIGFRLRLDGVVRATLGNEVSKSANGLMALEWFKEYQQTGDKAKLDQIVEYCKKDVLITRDLYLYGVENKFIFYETKSRILEKISVEWEKQETSYDAPNESKQAIQQQSLF